MDDELQKIREEKIESMTAEDQSATDSPAEPIHVDGGDHLQELAGEHDLVLVDFYADWCGPCKMLAPIVERLAADSPAAVAKVDVDANQQLAAQYQVRGVPTVVLFADGEPVERFSGVRGEEELRGLIDQYA